MSFKQAHRLEKLRASSTRDMFCRCRKLESSGVDVLDLTLGEPVQTTPQYIIEACKRAMDEGYTHYTDGSGIPELKEAVCEKLERENGLHYTPEEISVTTGVAQGMFLSIMSFLNEGDEILIPDPSYLTYGQIPHVAGAVIRTYDLLEENEYQVDPVQLEEKITDKTKMLVVVSPNNPTGSILNCTSLEIIARMARKYNLLVLTDDIYDHFVYDERQNLKSIASLPGMKERTIVLNGLSKTRAMTGWRLGYIAAPEDMIEPMNRLSFYITAGTCTFVQKAGITALLEDDGSTERMRLQFRENRDYLVRRIGEMHTLSCQIPQGAFFIFLNIRKTGMTSVEFCNYALDKYHIAMIPGTAFGRRGEGYARLSLTSSMREMERAAHLLDALDQEF